MALSNLLGIGPLFPSLQSVPVSEPDPRRKRLIRFAVAAAVLICAAGAAAAVLLQQPGNVSNPTAAFTAPAKPPPPPKPTVIPWSKYGFDSARSKWYRTTARLNPPYRRLWTYRGKKLLEFPPVLDQRGLYLLDDGGALRSLTLSNGHRRWRRQLGSLAASSPVLDGRGRIFAVTLLDSPSAGKGSAWALNTANGKVLWHHPLPSRAESSPLLVGKLMIFGTEDGTVFALNSSNGKTVWTFSAAGSVKGGLALSRGRLYFGDYGGAVHAISARTGRKIWTATPGGRFYSTGALAWGRFYVGNTDGRMYSYTTSGELAWAHQTGAYVYASPAVADAGSGPTVYGGSYNGTFYAWNARSGDVRWSYNAGGKISGGAFVIGNLVWFNDLGNQRTIALGARTGRKAFQMETGAFNPALTDGRVMYLVGYTNLYAFLPKKAK